MTAPFPKPDFRDPAQLRWAADLVAVIRHQYPNSALGDMRVDALLTEATKLEAAAVSADHPMVETVAQRVYMSDPDQGMGHGAWGRGLLSVPIMDHYRQMARNFLTPCADCGPLRLDIPAGDDLVGALSPGREEGKQ